MGALKPVKFGLIGCGAIANNAYMPTILKQYSMIDVVACADTVPERAALLAGKYGMKAVTNDEIYSDPEIEVVINLTFPTSHFEVNQAALQAGKHVHCEKMMGVSWEQGQTLAKLAEERGLHFTLAPDTFLGGAWQTCRKLIDDGFIGKPISAHCFVSRAGVLGSPHSQSMRRTLPQPDNTSAAFPFSRNKLPGHNPRTPEGSGLPFDMGGYYLHNLLNMFGNISRVSGFCKPASPAGSSFDPLNERYGEINAYSDPENLVGSLEFENGVYGSILFSTGVGNMPDQRFVVYGSNGVLICPDPNYFGGSVVIQSQAGKPMVFDLVTGFAKSPVWEVPLTHGYVEESRGVGLVDLAFAIRNHRKPRCHYSMGYQAFEVIHGIIDSCTNNTMHRMLSHCERPNAIQPGFRSGLFTGPLGQQSFLDD
jgi:predicted dehydrogenase